MSLAFYDKPNIPLLRKEGFTLVDMHFHSRFSDGSASVPNIVKKAAKLGVSFALTDHNRMKGNQKAEPLVKKLGIPFFVPGVEVSCKNGKDVLLFFYSVRDSLEFFDREIRKNMTRVGLLKREPTYILEIAKNYNAVVSIPHPYGYSYKNITRYFRGKESYFKYVDAIEVFNSTLPHKNNMKALKMALSLNKPMTAGTDSHTLFPMGRGFTCAHAATREEFLHEVVKGNTLIVGKEMSIIKKGRMGISNIYRNLIFKGNNVIKSKEIKKV